MSNTTKKQLLLFPIYLLAACLLFSCGKYKELADTDYPGQVLYMPSAGQLYQVTTPANTFEVPTPGNPYRFRVDAGTNKVIVPLGVVRGGKDNAGSINISIVDRPDTVNALLNNGSLQAQLLPNSAYSFPAAVILQDGKDAVAFDLVIDRNFLLARPGQVFAVGISISSKDRQTDPQKETTVVVFNTSLLN